jgi:hypothetical protein
MARTIASLPAGSRITSYIRPGVVPKFFPLQKVHQVLTETNRTSLLERDLPAHLVVYCLIALALYMRLSSREVLRCLLEGVRTKGALYRQSRLISLDGSTLDVAGT